MTPFKKSEASKTFAARLNTKFHPLAQKLAILGGEGRGWGVDNRWNVLQTTLEVTKFGTVIRSHTKKQWHF